MEEQVENLEIQNNEETAEPGLYDFDKSHNIFKLNAETFDSALVLIKELELTVNHFLIEKTEGLLLVTKEALTVDHTKILEKLQ